MLIAKKKLQALLDRQRPKNSWLKKVYEFIMSIDKVVKK